jgi:hypothetical protein
MTAGGILAAKISAFSERNGTAYAVRGARVLTNDIERIPEHDRIRKRADASLNRCVKFRNLPDCASR